MRVQKFDCMIQVVVPEGVITKKGCLKLTRCALWRLVGYMK